jgi:RNA polymerase sigma-70 factor (ECF subfamily)
MKAATPSEPDLLATRRTLLSRLRNLGDDASWQQFFDLYWRLIYSVATKAGLSDAEAQDAVQETFIAVSQTMPTFDYKPETCGFRAWLRHLAKKKIADQFRRRGRHPRQAGEDDAGTAVTPPIEEIPDPASLNLEAVWDAEFDRRLYEAALEKVKAKVNPQQFQIYDLYVQRELPVGEVVRLLHRNRAQVYLAKHRITQLIKAELARLKKAAGE